MSACSVSIVRGKSGDCLVWMQITKCTCLYKITVLLCHGLPCARVQVRNRSCCPSPSTSPRTSLPSPSQPTPVLSPIYPLPSPSTRCKAVPYFQRQRQRIAPEKPAHTRAFVVVMPSSFLLAEGVKKLLDPQRRRKDSVSLSLAFIERWLRPTIPIVSPASSQPFGLRSSRVHEQGLISTVCFRGTARCGCE